MQTNKQQILKYITKNIARTANILIHLCVTKRKIYEMRNGTVYINPEPAYTQMQFLPISVLYNPTKLLLHIYRYFCWSKTILPSYLFAVKQMEWVLLVGWKGGVCWKIGKLWIFNFFKQIGVPVLAIKKNICICGNVNII